MQCPHPTSVGEALVSEVHSERLASDVGDVAVSIETSLFPREAQQGKYTKPPAIGERLFPFHLEHA